MLKCLSCNKTMSCKQSKLLPILRRFEDEEVLRIRVVGLVKGVFRDI